MLPFTKTIRSLISSFSERIDSDKLDFEQSLHGPVTWLSDVGWNQGSGSSFQQLNYNHIRQISQSGASVNGKIASSISAFWACTHMIATDIAKLDLNVIERDARDNKVIRNNHPLWKIISLSPDGQTISQTFWETFILHTLVWGNGYALIGPRDPSNGQINQLEQIHPNLVNIRKKRGVRFYEIYPSIDDLKRGTNKIKDVPQEQMLHLHGPGDGFSGWPIPNYAKEALGISLSLQELQAALFSNGMSLGGTLTTAEELDPVHRKNMAKEWTETHAGAVNRNKVAVLDKSIEYKQLNANAVDSEVLESRKFYILEVARFFRVPPHKLGITDAATLNNIEQENIKYVNETLSPWIKRIQGLIKFRLLPARSNFFVEFDKKELDLSDTETRMKFWTEGIGSGISTPNQGAEDFGLPTYVDGDEHYIKVNNLAPVKAANMGTEKAEAEIEGLKLTNEGTEKTNNEPTPEPVVMKPAAAPAANNPKPKQEAPEINFNNKPLMDIFKIKEFIQAAVQPVINKEKSFWANINKNKAKLGAMYDSSQDNEKITRFYNGQRGFLRECLCIYFEQLNMPEPSGFINKWSTWQDCENWADQKAFLIANDLIKYYCGAEDLRDGEYEYEDRIVLLENGILRCN